VTVPPTGAYWTEAKPTGDVDLATMRQGATKRFDNVWLHHPGAILARHKIHADLEHTLEDSTVGNPKRTPVKFHGKTYAATAGSVEYAAMASIVWPFLSDPVDVLEIGAGYGGLARVFILGGKVKSYTIVDLPEVGRCARYFLGTYANVRVQDPDGFAAETRITYDLAIQTRGFMEMSMAEVEFYFDRLQGGAVKPGGLFFTINRRRKVTAFEDYPFDDRWEVLVDGIWPEFTGMVMKLLRRTA
jgi:hypothetical protein